MKADKYQHLQSNTGTDDFIDIMYSLFYKMAATASTALVIMLTATISLYLQW